MSGFILTRHDVLVFVSAAEARNPAGDEDHQADGHATDDQQELQVDLTISAGEPISTFALHFSGADDDAFPVSVAEVAFGGRGGTLPAGEVARRDVVIAFFALAQIRACKMMFVSF